MQNRRKLRLGVVLGALGGSLGNHFGSQNQRNECRNSFENRDPVSNVDVGNLGASSGRLGIDFEVILWSFFGPRLEKLIF